MQDQHYRAERKTSSARETREGGGGSGAAALAISATAAISAVLFQSYESFAEESQSLPIETNTTTSFRTNKDSANNSSGNEDATTAVDEIRPMSRIVFLGTGNSTGTPRPSCVMNPRQPHCETSLMAILGHPKLNRNYRCNPSLLVQYKKTTAGEEEVSAPQAGFKNIQIDCGKHYRESLCRIYPEFNVDGVDAVVLTHDHADAIMGLDDIRAVQRSRVHPTGPILPIPVFVGERHLPTVKSVYPYLFPGYTKTPHKLVMAASSSSSSSSSCDENIDGTSTSTTAATTTIRNDAPCPCATSNAVKRFVARVDFKTFGDFETIRPGGLEMTPVPLWHGSDYLCTGYLFGNTEKVAYLSDVSEIPASTMKRLRELDGGIDLLVIDALFLEKSHPTHLSMSEAIDVARELRPKRTLLVGVSDQMEHYETNAKLAALKQDEGLDIQIAHDGMAVEVCLA